jgi:hypothetical protein
VVSVASGWVTVCELESYARRARMSYVPEGTSVLNVSALRV